MSKKLGLAIIVVLIFVATTAQMWIRQGSQAQEWTVGHAGIGATLTEVKAAATGKQHHITLILNQSTTSTANQWSIESGTGANCETATTAVLPASSVSEKYVGATNAQAVQVIPLWGSPIHVTPGHAICVLGIATQLSRINIVGYTTP